MRKLFVSEFTTLDGVMEAPEEWQFPYLNEEVLDAIRAEIFASGASLLGRVTYQMFASYWPTRTDNEMGIADRLNSEPKFVVSATLEKAEWNNTTMIRGNVAEEIAKLKLQPGGDIRITGSGALVRSLLPSGLIDEFHLMVHPLVRGHGRRLFADGDALNLQLVESRAFNGGVVLLRYQPDREQ